MKIKRTSTASLPIDRNELRQFANLHSPDFDGELEAFQSSAVDDIQGLAHCKIGSAMYTIYTDSYDYITELPASLFPITRIVSVTYLDSDEVEQTLAADQYQFDVMAFPQTLVMSGTNIPSITPINYASDAPINPIRINVVAGYGDSGEDAPLEYQSIPANLKQAVKHLTLHRFLHRETVGAAAMLSELPYGVRSIVSRHKKRRVW